jgi:hypothetical protein
VSLHGALSTQCCSACERYVLALATRGDVNETREIHHVNRLSSDEIDDEDAATEEHGRGGWVSELGGVVVMVVGVVHTRVWMMMVVVCGCGCVWVCWGGRGGGGTDSSNNRWRFVVK